LLNGLKSGLAQSTGDTYTEYLNAEEAKEFNNDLNGTFSGIGAELSREKEQLVIVAPISGYPAEEAGLRAQDAILEIDGEPTYDLSLTEAVNKIRGPAGTEVELTIGREGVGQETYKITREDIKIPSVEYEVKDGIGYLEISRFAEDTVNLSKEAAQSFKDQNVKGVVLDMRNNPGGLLDAAVDISSLWLDEGEVVLEEQRGGEVIKSYRATGNNILSGIPTVVLVNEGSASASEIVAGALADNGAAKLVGQQTFGKGSVQTLEPISSGGVLKVTIARWFTPGGRNIDKEGIKPDKVVEMTIEDYEADRDPQQQAAIELLQ
jgi:carboxyl-terminal processing protease